MGTTLPPPEHAHLIVGARRPLRRYFWKLARWQRPTDIPPVFWEHIRHGSSIATVIVRHTSDLLVVAALTPLVLMTFQTWGIAFPVSRGTVLQLLVAYYLLVIPIARACYRRTKVEFARHLLANDGAICWECGYSLIGFGQAECRCPECGTEYDKDYLARRWLEWIRTDELPSMDMNH